MTEHLTICATHNVDGINPHSPDCPICRLEKELDETKQELLRVSQENLKLKPAVLTSQNEGK